MAEKSPVLGKKWAFCKGFAGCFPRILLTGRGVSCKKTLGIEKTYKKTVGLDRPYISHICIRGKRIFGRFWVAFEGFWRGFRSKIYIKNPKNSKKTVGSRNRCKFRIAAPNSYKFHVGKDRGCKIGQTADRGRKIPLNCDGRWRQIQKPTVTTVTTVTTDADRKNKKPEERLLSHW